jgi:DNA repair exonuclease SbcCD nuclease subunit
MIKVAHIADIHIRGLSRHAEYRDVFEALIDDVRKNGIEHIFVGGDIFHTKTTGLSPEYIDFVVWWFNAMASAAEVHLTLGNHDGNLVNSSRQDAVSPIVEALNNPRVHLYKMSGNYEFTPGYVWCVFSLFDVEGWKNVKPIEGKINIACYHGPVSGATTETNWTVDEGLTIEFFDPYDFVFLGDIHKMQYMRSREAELVINESDMYKYPGAEIIEEIDEKS